jgi:hypothetical protein
LRKNVARVDGLVPGIANRRSELSRRHEKESLFSEFGTRQRAHLRSPSRVSRHVTDIAAALADVSEQLSARMKLSEVRGAAVPLSAGRHPKLTMILR